MAVLKKNTMRCNVVAALMVVMATALLLSSCGARKEIDGSDALFVPASCYSNYFPHCTDHRCKKFCGGVRAPPVPGAFCNDRSNCCCPVS
ncbi:uncharacterized protein [Aegilops tauschii subsp. strangulata]|uniref:Uncharacterized protein n=1 Tax=Aegilops tauschii TaxID=37682 RepID=R7WGC1_AEGTA|nr:uncharacterized protein LOC109786842 [Aegilops tauschii subsp. strangulata]